jgi:hypothetical protein
MAESLAKRDVVRIAKSRHIDRFAVLALMWANELLGFALGVRLAKLREPDDRLAGARFCYQERRKQIPSPADPVTPVLCLLPIPAFA